MRPYVAIIDYGMGNLFSICKVCQHVDLDAIVTFDKEVIEKSSGIILPGVGAFGDAIENLRKLDLISVLRDAIKANKPFLGICLGMQLLMTESEEFGIHKGLNIIKGKVIKFPMRNIHNEQIKVPNIGWNKIIFDRPLSIMSRILKNVESEEFMYFVHSYYIQPFLDEHVLTMTNYCGVDYCSGLARGNLYAFQFHPEKSGIHGIEIYKNFREILMNSGVGND